MENMRINQDWYGLRAKIIEENENYSIVDYGCQGHGVITCYYLFEGIQICFLDFDTEESMPSQKFNPDIIQITHCRTGRYECEFSNHTVSYLPESYFGVAGTLHLPVSFSFPLKKCYAVSLVIDKQALTDRIRRMMDNIPINLDKIGETLGIDKSWYLSTTPPKLQHLFSEIYEAQGIEQAGYFRIKAIELLYHIDQLTKNNGCDFKYFDKGQIQVTKDIRDYMISHLEIKPSLEELTREAKINLPLFHTIFNQIYGDTPYSYLKKYKMNIAAQQLLAGKTKIGDIAVELGYNNASKFAKAFQSVYGVLPKDYRKNKK
ncbi:MAG: helix-turn-helix transcriptional regulator [Lachnospiraceae bacterium]|nr:helix-turn-helix transcriptional regulator [Lachnospiraceae bacterium]